ncbi:hypothetical protein H6P81_018627 [Aristolochia fimbriata]|uniref:Prolamin-like domain-containing protein n=1 Tax=Aristolochia fimbriata TaxID=158543 RepID=A0AAV7E5X5_ARIFI|nr:hypothetical protein H6P81_018627 [Aristolochia fimbriata]
MVKGAQLTMVLLVALATLSLPTEAILHYREPPFPVYNFTEFKKCDKIFKAVAGEAFMGCATAILDHLTKDTFSFSQACCKAENAISNLPCWNDSIEYFSPVIPKWYSVLVKDYCASGKSPSIVPILPLAEAPSPL